jgi:hypothetical protein
MIHVLFRNVPCDVEPEVVGEAECRKALLGEGMCDVVCTSGKPFYAKLLPDLPPMYARETPLEAYMAYLTHLADLYPTACRFFPTGISLQA